MSEITKAEGEAWQVGFEEGYDAGKRKAADRIAELERQVAMWTDVHDADSLRLSELERALADIENYYAQHYREGEVGYQAVLIARDVKRIRP